MTPSGGELSFSHEVDTGRWLSLAEAKKLLRTNGTLRSSPRSKLVLLATFKRWGDARLAELRSGASSTVRDAPMRESSRSASWVHSIERIVSNPFQRCLEPVGPLAEARALEIEHAAELAPDAYLEETKALLVKLGDEALVSTHREVLERLFGGRLACETGGTWVVKWRGSRLLPVEYLPPDAEGREQARHQKLVPSR